MSEKVYLVTSGDGSPGDEWGVIGIYSTRKKAKKAQKKYQKKRYRPDGSTYIFFCDIEVWDVDND